MKIKVVDSIMGSGKTSAAIELMNNDKENNYIFITPYLDEVERIKSQCTTRQFYEPKVYSKHGETFYKLDSLHNLISNGKNIATTHALFKMATDETKELIYAGNYILILDEVMDVIKQLDISSSDVKMLLDTQWIVNDSGSIKWNEEKEKSEGNYLGEFQTVKRLALNHNLILHKEKILIWNFPADIFLLFKNVYVLTYLFDAQIQKYYYDLNNIQYEKYISTFKEGYYQFEKNLGYSDKEIKNKLKSKIHIYDGPLNNIGDDYNSLSKSWYENKRHMHNKLKNNILNYVQNICKSKSNYNLWTTFKDYKNKLSGKGYTKGFLSCTIRATNEYRHKNCLVYTVNRFVSPILKTYFSDQNVTINEDLFALSELIQWLWRSAIRDDKEINIYIPSKRMRNLLIDWLNDDIK